MVNAILSELFHTLGGDLVGNSMIFGLLIIGALFVMVLLLRLPAGISFAFIFPVMLAFSVFGYFPIWIKAVSSITIGVVWFFVMKSLIND